MLMRLGIAQKEPVILVFGKVPPHKVHYKVDAGINLLAGKPGGESIGEFGFSGKLQKTGKRLFVELFGKPEAHLVWSNFHRKTVLKKG
jgi:hypothetical protein